MQNKELPFVIASTLMEESNNIKVTTTTNNEEDLKEIKKLDLIGGAIDIQCDEDNLTKEDLLIEKK